MKIYGFEIPESDQEFFKAYAQILWYEERLTNLIAAGVNRGLYGKPK